jgi:phosphoglycerate dehydrogenase-like enzyme
MEGHRAGVQGERGVSGPAAGVPLRILLTRAGSGRHGTELAQVLAGVPHRIVPPDAPALDADIAFVTRDVTGLSTKHQVEPATRAFYDAMEASASLRWVHIHSAGADRPIYQRLLARGVQVSTSSGANALVVAHSALAGLLSLARHLPRLAAAQRERRWASLIATGLPRDLEGSHAVLVGWGPIARNIARMLQAVGMRITVVRRQAQPVEEGFPTVAWTDWHEVLPQADWVLLACPLTPETQGLVDAKALACLPPHAHLINVARGEIVDQAALVDALRSGRLAGAFLDVFGHEPLPPESPLWTLENVILTPHSAGHSDGNEGRVARMFLDNLRRWLAGQALQHLASLGR